MPRFRQLFSQKTAVVLIVAAAFAGCFAIYTDVRQTMGNGVKNPNDFVTLYAGAICMSSDCNPYRVADLDKVLRDRRGDAVLQKWTDQLPIYPPTTMFLLKPVGALSYHNATLAWYLLSLTVYIAGVTWTFLLSSCLRTEPLVLRVVGFLLALHFPKMMQCLSFGNPSLIVTGLLLFAVFDRVDARYIPRVICAGVAVWLKFTVALPLMVLLLFSDRARPRRAWISTTVFLAATSGLLFYATYSAGMHHWSQDLWQDVALGEQNGMSAYGRISPSNVLLNAANIPGYFTRDRAPILAFVLVSVGALSAALGVAAVRLWRREAWGQSAYEAVIPAVAVLSLLPVYHRFCDIGLLLFLAPWLIRRMARHRDALMLSTTVIVGLLYFSWERRIHLERFSGKPLRVVEFLYYRGDALLVFTLAVLLVLAVYRQTTAQHRRLVSG